MIRAILVGAEGRMGRAVHALAAETEGVEIVARIDPSLGTSFTTCRDIADVVIDFSVPAALPDELTFCVMSGLPLVLATTGHNEDAQALIDAAAQQVAIIQSANFSYGAFVLAQLVHKAHALLQDAYDVSIIETHHRAKKDAPSGTAKLLARAMDMPSAPMLSIRGGSVVGTHQVQFLGSLDAITLQHEALDKRLFAIGALDAAKWITGCAPGLYGMGDFLEANGRHGEETGKER